MRQLTDTERRLRDIYLDGNQDLFFSPCTEDDYASWPCHDKIAAALHFSIDKENGRYIFENQLISSESSVKIIHHTRYLPAVIHSHEFIKVICIDNGDGILYIDGIETPVTTGDVCIVGAHTPHTLIVFNDNTDAVNILMRSTTFDQIFMSLVARDDVLSRFFMKVLYDANSHMLALFRCGLDERITQIKQNLYQENKAHDAYSSRVKESYLLLLFSFLLRFHEKDFVIINRGSKAQDINILACLNYIDKHLTTVTLSKLSEEFLYTTAYLSRLIKSYTGMSFIKIVNKKKLEQAKKMLHNTNIPINSIVEDLGYTDSSHFYRSFKSEYGVTPVEYRRTK